MEKMLFIINPVAGGKKTKDLIPLIEAKMKENKIDYEILITKKPKDATKLAYDTECKIVVAVGGDGTINEVAKGLIRKKSGILGIIPAGTGNDFSKTLDISQNPIEALDIIIKGKTIKVDTGIANNQEFLNIASVGFDAEVVDIANRLKRKSKINGKFAYVFGVIYTVFTFRKRDAIIHINGEKYKRSMMLIAMGNGNYYGGGMKILPYAKVDDGNLHICIVKDISNLKLLFLFPSIFKGNHLKYIKYIETFKGKIVDIKLERQTSFNVDGDLFKGDMNFQVSISDYKLEVLKDGYWV